MWRKGKVWVSQDSGETSIVSKWQGFLWLSHSHVSLTASKHFIIIMLETSVYYNSAHQHMGGCMWGRVATTITESIIISFSQVLRCILWDTIIGLIRQSNRRGTLTWLPQRQQYKDCTQIHSSHSFIYFSWFNNSAASKSNNFSIFLDTYGLNFSITQWLFLTSKLNQLLAG